MRTIEYAGRVLTAERDLNPAAGRIHHWVDRNDPNGEVFHIVPQDAVVATTREEAEVRLAQQYASQEVERAAATAHASAQKTVEKVTLVPTHLVDGEIPVVETIGKDGVARYFTIEGDVKGKMVAVKDREVTPFPNAREPDKTDKQDRQG